MILASHAPTPEQEAAASQTNSMLEIAVIAERYRTVLMMRDIEELSTSETAEVLDLTEENVKAPLPRPSAAAQRAVRARWKQSQRSFRLHGNTL